MRPFTLMSAVDQTVTLLRRGDLFAQRVRDSRPVGVDPEAVPVRLLGRAALLVRGPAAVALFGDPCRTHQPDTVAALLSRITLGDSAVPGLDDSDRVHRLGYVAAVTDAAAEDALLDGVRHAWRARLGSWPAGASVYDAAVSVLGRASLSWVAASLEGHMTDAVASDIAVSLDGRGLVGPATLRAARARRRAAAWSADAVAAARTGRTRPAAGSALAVMARATTERGQLLSEATAGEVLLHLVRPALAAARLAPFAALALHAQPQWRERVRREAAERSLATPGPLALALARRLRLATPGIPVVASVARRESLFRGRAVPAGTLLLLDVAGTPQPLDLGEDVPGAVPRRLQASGEDQPAGCRRDQMITAALAVTAAELALAEWTVPEQDLRVPLHRMPTLPRSGVVLGGVSHALAPSGR